MKAVLISIQPKWCELIASGKKTVEVRKTKPILETPFKVYIYATEPKHKNDFGLCLDDGKVGLIYRWNYGYARSHNIPLLSGKVIGEFVCDKIYCTRWERDFEYGNWYWNVKYDPAADCLTPMELAKYIGNKAVYYGWHISDLVIYDKPKELSEFYQKCKSYDKDEWTNDDCLECENICGNGGKLYLTRPPQSWCYVEGADQ